MERPDSRLIRVFLSSTFVDFQEERSLLVQQVFPSLRRRARSREVEIVDVDLRWGVTAEQTERGETLPLCLGEIDRCRPYFISLLGERYGWVPPPDYYKPELLERQPWLKERMGGASVTELEILHGVLRNPEMAGHAFFYLRDPAYAQAQSEPGWVAENLAERQRLEALKAQIRASGFPVAEGLPSPQAIAERIEADLWQLIESRFPEQEPADALEREDRRHSDYRRARTGLYLGGGPAIEQLERWVADGEQRILINGESGAGKSALIANWLEAHQRSHPQDLVHAHHLGCTNDASAVRALLGRLIDTASHLLMAEQQISEAIQVPQDWWELVFKVGEVFALLSPWCQRQGRRWILVLDGLDRLAEEDQQALPWIPTTIPPGIHVVASALDCQARTILQERQYRTHEIGPLGKAEQQQLIERYLNHYTKQLESGLQQRILTHPLAGSPLFLRVLLEELRQCAWFDTLQEQVTFYLSAESIDGLYAKVLERLERDGHGEATRKALTALWASRAGLSEEELLAITGLAPAAWAPIGISLQDTLSETRGRLLFGHDYLRIAVRDRYLLTEEQQRQAHSDLADWFEARDGWDERDSEELPWQLKEADRLEDLKDCLLNPLNLAILQSNRGSPEVINYWLAVKTMEDAELDDLIVDAVEKEIENLNDNPADQIRFVDNIAKLLHEAGLYRETLLRLSMLSLELKEVATDRNESLILKSLGWLASIQQDIGHYEEAESLFLQCLEIHERQPSPDHPSILAIVGKLGSLYSKKGNYEQAEDCYNRCMQASERLLGPEHPDTLNSISNLGLLYSNKGNYKQAEALDTHCLEARERLLGPGHTETLTSLCNLGALYIDMGDYVQGESFSTRALEATERLLGPEHPDTLVIVGNLGTLYSNMGNYTQAEACYTRCLQALEKLLGPEHPLTLTTINNLGRFYSDKGDYKQAEALYSRCLDARERLFGPDHPDTLIAVGNLGVLYIDMGDYAQAEVFSIRALEAYERQLGPDHPSTLTQVDNLGVIYSDKGNYKQAEALYGRCLDARERLFGPEHPDTLITVCNLACHYQDKGDYEQAEGLFNRCLDARERLLGPVHPDTLITLCNLAGLYKDRGNYEHAVALFHRCLDARERLLGPEHPDTLITLCNLAGLYKDRGNYEHAVALFNRCLDTRERLLGAEHPDTFVAAFGLAEALSALDREAEAIPLRRRVLAWSQQQHGENDPSTLHLLNQLAIDLRVIGELEESETLFRKLVSVPQEALAPGDFDIGCALGGLAKTLTEAGKLDEALVYAKQALDRRLEDEEPDAWSTNCERLDLALLLLQLDRNLEALQQLQDLHDDLDRRPDLDDYDCQLLDIASTLRCDIVAAK